MKSPQNLGPPHRAAVERLPNLSGWGESYYTVSVAHPTHLCEIIDVKQTQLKYIHRQY